MYDIQITGVDRVIANLNKLDALIKLNMKQGLIKASDRLRDSAISNLANSRWPTSVVDMPIRNKESWVTIDSGVNSIILQCQSNHAAAVELGTWGSSKLGGDGRFHAQELTDTGGPFPIGKSQGILVRFSMSIAPQQPKSYLGQAMRNQSTIDAMIREVGNVLNRAIMSVGT